MVGWVLNYVGEIDDLRSSSFGNSARRFYGAHGAKRPSCGGSPREGAFARSAKSDWRWGARSAPPTRNTFRAGLARSAPPTRSTFRAGLTARERLFDPQHLAVLAQIHDVPDTLGVAI